MTRRLVGAIVDHEGALSLQTSPRVWYPLGGNSGLAADFVEAFGKPQRGDIGKRVYYVGGVMQMENDEQRAERLAEPRAKFTPSSFGGGWIVPANDAAFDVLTDYFDETPADIPALGDVGYIVEPADVEDTVTGLRAAACEVTL